MLSERKKFRCFFAENGLKNSRLGDILMFGGWNPYTADSAPELLSSVISAKGNENLPSLEKLFCSQKRNNPARDLSVFVSCWAFLRRFESRFLAGPSLPRTGNRPAFFVPGRCLVRRNDTLPLRSPCFRSIVPTVMKSIQPEIRSSGGFFHTLPANLG